MQFLTINQMAQKKSLPAFALRRLVKESRIPYIKVGNRVYLVEEDVADTLLREAMKNVKGVSTND